MAVLIVLSYTTYHKWLNKFFGHSKDDVHWYGWAMHGFTVGFASIVFFGCWGLVLARAFFLALLTMLWSLSVKEASLEEFGRGFVANITIPIIVH
jgi:hypothetical protein